MEDALVRRVCNFDDLVAAVRMMEHKQPQVFWVVDGRPGGIPNGYGMDLSLLTGRSVIIEELSRFEWRIKVYD